ncbi:Piso0_001613 [Millerozyma farinosa CBS 7064]|uniref:Piso0_001613 protein n=1 Tax=Pichia sorbitophila (strain ATCC MYA-4447 / BCRC 22081 / CBS 7064 / NBRC 10061 / NRRL Y-12695) TaxID=559304 RepID=G8YNM3_PICSO|nr:Piso0_001613 [Millerozyma farinosa CBS 7064]
MATKKMSETAKHGDSGIISSLLMSSESGLKLLFKYSISPILLSYSIFSIYWISVYLLFKLSLIAILLVLSPSSLVDFISDYHHYKKEEAKSDSELLNTDQGLDSTDNPLIRNLTRSEVRSTFTQRICDLAILLFRSFKQQENVLAIRDRLEESLYVLEKGEYVFDRYMKHSIRYVTKNIRPSEEDVYKFKGVALRRSEGFIHYIKRAREMTTLQSRPDLTSSNKTPISNKQVPVVNESNTSPTMDVHPYRIPRSECDQLVYQESTLDDTVQWSKSDEIKGIEYEQKVFSERCQDESFVSSQLETPKYNERPSTDGIILENRGKDLNIRNEFNTSSSNPDSSSLRKQDRQSGNTGVSSPPVLSQSMKHKIESYLDKYKENLNTNKPLQVRTRGLSSNEQMKLINIELPNKQHSILKLSITPKKPKKNRIQNENISFLSRKIKKSLSMEDSEDTIKKVTEI